jgi:RPA family protein
MTQQSTDAESSDDESSTETTSSSPGRQVARRVFATEYNRTHRVVQGDGDQAPRFVVLPTGQTANRIYLVGTLTEVTDKGNDSEYFQARVVGPTGTFRAYAGQYQQEAQQFLRNVEPPTYVGIVAKPGEPYEIEDGQANVPLNIEEINTVDAETRDRWVQETAELTVSRINAFDPDDPEAPAEDAHLTTSEGFHPDPDLDELREEVENAIRDMQDGESSESADEGDSSTEEAEAASQESSENEADEEPPGLRDQIRAEVGLRDAGNGADRDDVVQGVAEKLDVEEDVVEAELEEALEDGEFYEPDGDSTVKSI